MKYTGRLSKTFVDRVNAPGRYGDGRGGFGLSLLVKPTKNGGWSRTYSQRLRVQGLVVNIGLGPAQFVTLDDARAQAIDNARVAWGGGDPRKPKVTVPTFADVAELVIAERAKSWTPATTQDWRGTIGRYVLPKLGSRRIDQIDTQDVYAVLEHLLDKPSVAGKIRRYTSTVMTWAVAHSHRPDNPVDAVKALLPKSKGHTEHHKALPHSEIGAALETIRAANGYPGARDALEFLILTAARSGEVRGARWDEIDLDAATWTIPADRTKTGAEHTVPLSVRAVEALGRANAYNDASGLIFPSSTGRTMSAIILRRVLDTNGIDATVHGFRSSFRDWCAENGTDRELAESALAHVVGGVEGAYRRSDLLNRRRELMQAWADYISENIGANS